MESSRHAVDKDILFRTILTLERPTIKYSIVYQAGLAGPLSIFTHKLTYLFNISKWILLRMLYDHYKYNSLLVKINKLIINSNQYNLFLYL